MQFVKHLSTSIMNFNNTISKGGKTVPRVKLPPAPLNETLHFIYVWYKLEALAHQLS